MASATNFLRPNRSPWSRESAAFWCAGGSIGSTWAASVAKRSSMFWTIKPANGAATPSATFEAGDALQAFLYVLAAEQLLRGESRLPWRTGYWFISSGGYTAKQALPIHELADEQVAQAEEWQVLREQNIKRILDLVDAVRAGEFAVSSRDDQCTSHCSFHTVCRVNQVRSLEKAWEPPTLGS